nr:immunoglobulin light chain junction region [Macaca mulatta]MOW66856.1 immunoglobulin light chain junction region [Macaca mulatta]MOW67538.1 immunoglobulin light chain junction region [Macaca mulatta]MOW68888.1 immunoglobulin light chain junction region [Macaca mulatta]MOW69194.1 immunoglobulin light chain junction region [Macaca mulatta]
DYHCQLWDRSSGHYIF